MTKHHRHRDRGLVPNRWHVGRRSSLLPSAGGQLGSTGPVKTTTAWKSRSHDPDRSTIKEMRERQAAKIREFRVALAMSGFFALDKQAEVLGLNRSTAWTILKGNHKTSGLSAATVNQILAAPRLPLFVRAKILEYCEEKAAGLYGHSKSQRRRFIAQCQTLDSSNTPFWDGQHSGTSRVP
jgi:hypothetical protein